MKFYLVKETEVFVDPHGTPDSGSVKKYVMDEENLVRGGYEGLDGKYICGDEEVDEGDLQGSEDGYNSTCQYFEITEITEEQYHEFKEIISKYEEI